MARNIGKAVEAQAAKILTQRAEFEAADKFAVQTRRVLMTAVVDDDYPEVRWEYEQALFALLEACKLNGREWPK